MDMCTSITFSTATSSNAILLLLVKYSKTYNNKVSNTDVIRLLKVEFKPKGRVKAVRASIGNTDVLRLLKVEFKPKGRVKALRACIGNTVVLRLLKVDLKLKGRVKAVRASIGKNRFLTKSLRLTKGFLPSIVTGIKRVLLLEHLPLKSPAITEIIGIRL